MSDDDTLVAQTREHRLTARRREPIEISISVETPIQADGFGFGFNFGQNFGE